MAAKRYLPIVAFALAAMLANILTTRYGFVPVGFGLTATAGTYAAGVALVARDYVHDALGYRGVAVAILIGAGLSFLTAAPAIALASVVAFAVSETADAFVYTPLRRQRWRTAVVASSIVGAVIDTALFVAIAFGTAGLTPQVMAGQLVGKVLWVAIPVAIVGGAIRNRRAMA